MTRTAALALAAVTLGLSVLVAAGAAPSSAEARQPELTNLCGTVKVPGLALKNIEAQGQSCGAARSTIRGTWLYTGPQPDVPIDEIGRPEYRLGYWCPKGAGELDRRWRCPFGDTKISFRPVLASPLSRCPAFSGGSGGLPSVSEMYVHVITCGQARDLARHWFQNPQGGYAGYFDSNGPWFCGRPQPDLQEPNPSGPVGCSFSAGGTSAYMRLELNGPADDAEGLLFGAFVGPGTTIDKTEDLGTFNFVTCTGNDCSGRRYLTVDDELPNRASVYVEVWWGGKLRNVCWDSTQNQRTKECRPRVPRGRDVTLYIGEGLKRVWNKCWKRRNGAWVAPDGGCGKLKDRWGGPGRSGTPPPDAGPIVWGEGDFHARG
jgi:hypothetical protein